MECCGYCGCLISDNIVDKHIAKHQKAIEDSSKNIDNFNSSIDIVNQVSDMAKILYIEGLDEIDLNPLLNFLRTSREPVKSHSISKYLFLDKNVKNPGVKTIKARVAYSTMYCDVIYEKISGLAYISGTARYIEENTGIKIDYSSKNLKISLKPVKIEDVPVLYDKWKSIRIKSKLMSDISGKYNRNVFNIVKR